MHFEHSSISQRIQPLDEQAMAAARRRQDTLTKPPGSLGRLEELSIQLAGIFRHPSPTIEHKVILTMAGDHGVVAEGVSAFPQEITAQMVSNFLNGGAAINVLARHAGARVVVVDMGVAHNLAPHPGLISKKIGQGTRNLARGPAMTRRQAVDALRAGANVAEAQLKRGLDILAVGEMGIGNTTPSTAIASALMDLAPEEIAGRGTGVDDEGLGRKIDAVRRGLEINQPDPTDAVDVLAKVGGFEIGGMAGAMLAVAAHGRPVMVDGFIATAAAMISVGLAPSIKPYLIAGHLSNERGHRVMLDWLGLDPLLDLGMRLGEGTGAALGFSLAEAACRTLNEMATFAEAGLSGGDGAAG
jgi:nicotinate-nucleotide--dimethylbenzimidazole phosphoribosyltransferase